MKKNKLTGLDLDYFYEKLKNGLEVIYIPYKDKKNYFISYATRFGSETTKFIPINSKKEVKVPDGIAHFLEHKMFEMEDGIDPFTYFSESGTGSNASTSFRSTQYICYGTKKFNENLKYLIKFVNSPYYTDENVAKEKGIIIEELKMYDDIPDFKLDNILRENLFHVHPRRIDIGGTIEEVNKITKEDLYLCYENFYQPNNMFILIAGNFDIENASKIIHKELDLVKKNDIATVKEIKENKKILKKHHEVKFDINVPKIAFGLKIYRPDISIKEDYILDLYLEMITSITFGSSSLFREEVRNKKLLNSIYMEWEKTNLFRCFMLSASSSSPDLLVKEIKDRLNKLEISKDDFERMKKVWIANEVKMADYIDNTVKNVYDDMINYGKVISNRIDLIRSLDLKKLNKIISEIDFNNTSVVVMLPKSIKKTSNN